MCKVILYSQVTEQTVAKEEGGREGEDGVVGSKEMRRGEKKKPWSQQSATCQTGAPDYSAHTGGQGSSHLQ